MVRPEVKKKRQDLARKAVQSRKERKRIEKVILHKKAKLNRKQILSELKKHQLPSDDIDKLYSTSSMQTKGLKKFLSNDIQSDSKKLTEIARAERILDAATLLKRKRRKVKTAIPIASSSSSEDTDAISTDTETEEEFRKSDDVLDAAKDLESETFSENPSTEQIENLHDCNIETNDAVTKNDETPIEISNREFSKSEPAVYLQVQRDPEIESARLKLPIISEEQHIMEKIRYNDFVVISGETGSGKTTQLPQFLYEAGYTLNGKQIGITEPRRVAAVSMSERVAKELSLSQDEVSYQVRFAGNVTDKTVIKFMTDGVLVRESQQDFLLSKYSVVIIDEAHERSVHSDILIGMLSRIVPLRAKRKDPLKLVIMSATLRVTDFTENRFLFKSPPPVINVEARQFPVRTIFAKRTPENHLEAAYKKVRAIDSKLPKGGVLVFVTSQNDVKALCKKLTAHSNTLHCLGLYAMLSLAKQRLVFNQPPEGKRLCVVATNVAETSITIPNVRYVVDTGLEKQKLYDTVTGISRFVTTWTSKSSAEQRMGRAGRMGPGHCFRLYSSAVFTNDFPGFSEPAILRKPVEDVILQMKTMNIDNVINFPFPTRPSLGALRTAEKTLISLGALDGFGHKSQSNPTGDLNLVDYSSRPTPLGRKMANFPVTARCSKMLVLAPPDLIPYVVQMVAAMSVREMFLGGNKWAMLRKKWAGHGSSKLLGDFMIMIRAVSIADSFGCSNKMCLKTGLRTKAMLEADKMRKHLTRELDSSAEDRKEDVQSDMPKIPTKSILTRPTESQCQVLRQLLLSSHCDHVARMIPDCEIVTRNQDDPNKLDKRKLKNAYECMETRDYVYISTESVLRSSHPDYVIYRELYKGDKKTYMRDVAAIRPEWLPTYAPKLCNFNNAGIMPSANKSRYDENLNQMVCRRNCTYGPLNWPLGIIEVPADLVN